MWNLLLDLCCLAQVVDLTQGLGDSYGMNLGELVSHLLLAQQRNITQSPCAQRNITQSEAKHGLLSIELLRHLKWDACLCALGAALWEVMRWLLWTKHALHLNV